MYLGIEFGSTRIKGIVLDHENKIIASEDFLWETKLVGGYWSYDLALVWQGMRTVLQQINRTVPLDRIEAIGISAMMHGLIACDINNELLLPFRTWKNVNTKVAATTLSHLFEFNIPLRWSVSHIYDLWESNQAVMKKVVSVHTLASYVHFMLTGQRSIGVGDASGMFPVNSQTLDYEKVMLEKFYKATNIELKELLPTIVTVGGEAGALTQKGLNLLGIEGLRVGTIFAPPEGDAQTGMVATNALRPKTGNISAGTSVFAMLVLEKPLKKWYSEIDIVLTPGGNSVAMVHSNECTSLIDPWINLFGSAATYLGCEVNRDDLFMKMYEIALQPETPLGAFMRDKLVLAISELEKGINILKKQEGLTFDFLVGHGGYFKSKDVGKTIMSETLKTPIKTRENAGEGGAWGMAILAQYCAQNTAKPLDFVLFIDKIFEGEI